MIKSSFTTFCVASLVLGLIACQKGDPKDSSKSASASPIGTESPTESIPPAEPPLQSATPAPSPNDQAKNAVQLQTSDVFVRPVEPPPPWDIPQIPYAPSVAGLSLHELLYLVPEQNGALITRSWGVSVAQTNFLVTKDSTLADHVSHTYEWDLNAGEFEKIREEEELSFAEIFLYKTDLADLLLASHEAYFRVLKERQISHWCQTQLVYLDSVYKRVEILVGLGEEPRSSLDRVDGKIQLARGCITTSNQRLATALAELTEIIGSPVPLLPRDVSDVPLPDILQAQPPIMNLNAAISVSPELQRIEHLLHASQSKLTRLQYEDSNATHSSPPSADDLERHGAISIENLKVNQFAAQLDSRTVMIESDLMAIDAEFARILEQSRVSSLRLGDLARSYKEGLILLQGGELTIFDLLEMADEFFAVNSSIAQLQVEYLANYAKLNRVRLSEGFQMVLELDGL